MPPRPRVEEQAFLPVALHTASSTQKTQISRGPGTLCHPHRPPPPQHATKTFHQGHSVLSRKDCELLMPVHQGGNDSSTLPHPGTPSPCHGIARAKSAGFSFCLCFAIEMCPMLSQATTNTRVSLTTDSLTSKPEMRDTNQTHQTESHCLRERGPKGAAGGGGWLSQ